MITQRIGLVEVDIGPVMVDIGLVMVDIRLVRIRGLEIQIVTDRLIGVRSGLETGIEEVRIEFEAKTRVDRLLVDRLVVGLVRIFLTQVVDYEG
jgi:hypothetical protein